MLTVEQNERLTRVGPGTPMGELMRRYWHPIAPSGELSGGHGGHREAEQSGTPSMTSNPTKEIRLLGEDLVLFRDTSGRVGCIEPRCAHRKANLSYGIPESNGLRCPYHGWVYDTNGQCLEQPSEPVRPPVSRPDSQSGSSEVVTKSFKDKIKLKSYPAQELGGLIFVYMGPEPVPILPRWDILSWENATREVYYCHLPCNWLQCHENSLDPVHFEWLHGYWGQWVINRSKPPEEREIWANRTQARRRHHVKVGFDRFEYGIIKRRLLEGETEDDEWWRVGHPIVFPYTLRVGETHPTEYGRFHAFQYRVPVDDTHTLHLIYRTYVPPEGVTVPKQEVVPWREEPIHDENGQLRNDWVVAQDQVAWIIQGPITERETEALGVTDVGLIMFRRMLEEQMEIVADGGDPINVHREDKGVIVLPQEHSFYPGFEERGGPWKEQPIGKPDVEAMLI